MEETCYPLAQIHHKIIVWLNVFVCHQESNTLPSSYPLYRLSYKSKRTEEREGPTDMGATSTIQFETEKDRDAQAVFERSLQINKVSVVVTI